MKNKKTFKICSRRKEKVFYSAFLLLFSLIYVTMTSNQTCVYIKNYQVCYFMNDSQIHLTKCESSSCLQYSTDHDDCLKFTLISLTEPQCIKQLCGKNNLNSCIFMAGDLTTENQENWKKQLKISLGVGGSFVFVVLSFLVLRKVKCKKGLHQNVQVHNSSSNTNLNSIQSIQVFETIQIIKPNMRKKTLQPINSTSLSSFVHEFDQNPNKKVDEFSLDAMNKLCSICLDSDKINCETFCGHFYHLNCLASWLQRNPLCPQCRSKKFVPIKTF